MEKKIYTLYKKKVFDVLTCFHIVSQKSDGVLHNFVLHFNITLITKKVNLQNFKLLREEVCIHSFIQLPKFTFQVFPSLFLIIFDSQ